MPPSLQIIEPASQKDAKTSRARVGRGESDGAAEPGPIIPDLAKKLQDMLTADDLAGAVKVWREGLQAVKMVWNNKLGTYVEAGPDWQIRRDMSEMIAAYMEGKPMERQMSISGTFEELSDLLKTMSTSGEAARLMPFVHSLPSATERRE